VPAGSAAPAGPAVLTMRAAVVTAPGQTATEHVVRPEPGPGEARIRLEGSGVCGSNLAFWEGRPWFAYPGEPGAPGHEGWGVVDSVGPGVTTVAPGDRVATLAGHAYAEYDVAPASDLVPLPRSLDDLPFPGEPLGCAMNAYRRGEVETGQTVVIIGIGFLGAILTRLASRAGARVIAVSRRPFALEVARAQGAETALPLDDPGAVSRAVAKATGGAGADRVFEVVGLQGPLDLAAELTRIRGRLIIAGYHQDGSRQVNMQLWNWRGLDVINAHERDPAAYLRGMREAVAAVRDGVLDVDSLCTHCFPLDRLNEALEAMRTRPDGFLKALVLT
jgi:threonine dehydrogenase-like Zn-dependent dehydrogenase